MGERTQNVVDADLGETLSALAQIIKDRSGADPNKSYTARLLSEPQDKLFGKITEEALEVVMAAKDADHDHIRYEIADMMYHVMVLMERNGITQDELAGELRARMN